MSFRSRSSMCGAPFRNRSNRERSKCLPLIPKKTVACTTQNITWIECSAISNFNRFADRSGLEVEVERALSRFASAIFDQRIKTRARDRCGGAAGGDGRQENGDNPGHAPDDRVHDNKGD